MRPPSPELIPRLLCAVLCACLLPAVPPRISAADDKNQEKVNEAIDRGIEYLLGEIEKQQVANWRDDPGRRGPGQVALETYALVVAGVSVNHPLIKKNFEYLNDKLLATNYTYALACYAFALDAAIAQEEADLMLANMDSAQLQRKFRDNPAVGREHRPQLAAAINKICRLQKPFGGWSYDPGGNFDNSNTQFAVLGLGVGHKRNVPIEPMVWEKVIEHFLKQQSTKKGDLVKERLTLMADEEVADRRLRGKKGKEKVDVKVVPKEGEKAKGKDAAAGGKDEGAGEGKEKGATVVAKSSTKVGKPNPEMPEIGTENVPVYQRGWAYTEGQQNDPKWNMTCAGLSSLLLAREALKGRMPPDQQEGLNAAIRDGYGWLMTHWEATSSYYGMYSLEKVADIGEVKLFGSRDWYAELSEHLVGAQQPNGGWPGGGIGDTDSRVNTSFALLILNRATQLIMVSLTSQNPLSKIMVSGRRSNINDPTDRSWVYVPELDTTVHYPTLLRMIRLRPHPKLLKFLSSIVDHYPDEWKGELIPEMARVRDEIQQKEARKTVEGYLAAITGYRYQNWEDYLKWHARWEKVVLIGTQQKAERVPDLLRYYQHTQRSVPLKKTILWALLQCKAKDAIPLFLADLEHGDARVRLAAYNGFKAFYIDFPPPFDPNASDGVRAKQVEAIKAWYAEQLKK